MATTPRDRRRRLFGIAAEQGGYFSAAQAKELGYSYQAQAHHVDAGNWLRDGRGLFRLAEWVPGVHDNLARWALWSRGHGVVSHETALAVHAVGELESAKVHLTVPPGFRMHHDAVALHTASLPDEDVMVGDGFNLTTPIRSVLDVAGLHADDDQLARVIGEAVERGLLTLRRLRARAEAVDPNVVRHLDRAIAHLDAA